MEAQLGHYRQSELLARRKEIDNLFDQPVGDRVRITSEMTRAERYLAVPPVLLGEAVDLGQAPRTAGLPK